MLAKRIIPCLDIREGQTVKGINFVGLRNVGDPVELGAKYAAEGADELVYLDISATEEGRQTFTELVARIAERIDIPFTVGGGIASVADAGRLLDAGADKVTVNSAAVRDPALIDAIASKYGSQFVVAAIDARMTDGVWRVTTHGGKRMTDRELFAWAHEVCQRGAGELLFTSMDHDGTRDGYPCETFARLAELPIPHRLGRRRIGAAIADVLTLGRADAALAASIFHYNGSRSRAQTGIAPAEYQRKTIDTMEITAKPFRGARRREAGRRTDPRHHTGRAHPAGADARLHEPGGLRKSLSEGRVTFTAARAAASGQKAKRAATTSTSYRSRPTATTTRSSYVPSPTARPATPERRAASTGPRPGRKASSAICRASSKGDTPRCPRAPTRANSSTAA